MIPKGNTEGGRGVKRMLYYGWSKYLRIRWDRYLCNQVIGTLKAREIGSNVGLNSSPGCPSSRMMDMSLMRW